MDADQKIFSIDRKKDLSNKENKSRINNCPHTDKKYYAKGMCNRCYHYYGRAQMATGCPHKDAKAYALNMCLKCYKFQS